MEKRVLMEVPLDKIVFSETNNIFRKKRSFNNPEFISSIRENGVITAITLRFIPGTDTFMLVAGERRVRAMQIICKESPDRNTIPAYIQNFDEAQAFNAQMIENLHREEVHPLMEAQGYKKAFEELPEGTLSEKYAELSKRFGKSDTYIYRRMALLKLIPDAVKQYEGGQLLLGHALILARLEPTDQAQLLEDCKDRYNGGYRSVREFEKMVQERVSRDLSRALFNTKASGLIPKASSCIMCVKRSGASPLLFDDIQKKDVCFDSKCFEAKTNAWLYNTVKETFENKPDIRFAVDPREDDVISVIEKLMLANDVPILDSTKDFFNYDSHDTKVKISVMFLNGDLAGKIVQVFSAYKMKSEKKKEPNQELSPAKQKTVKRIESEEAIGRIKQRMKRAFELDQQKIYARVMDSLPKTKAFKFNSNVKEIELDKLMMRYVLVESCAGELERQIFKHFKIPKPNGLSPTVAKKRLEAIAKISDRQFTSIIRMVLLQKLSGQSTFAMLEPGLLLKQAAREFGEVPLETFEEEQRLIAEERTARFNFRISELKKNAKT